MAQYQYKRKVQPCYSDLRHDVYNLENLLAIAKRAWRIGTRYGEDGSKVAFLDLVGVNARRAYWLDTKTGQEIPNQRWVNVSEFQVKLDARAVADYPGTVRVRKIGQKRS